MEGVFLSVCDLSIKPEVDVQVEFLIVLESIRINKA
jgi:hypothetical protein